MEERVAHGQVVTSSRQTTELKQRGALLVSTWMGDTGTPVTLLAMSRCCWISVSYHASLSSDGCLVERES